MGSLADALSQDLASLPTPSVYVVAYSGGLDSHVLLHALLPHAQAAGIPVTAVHIHHGLLAHADSWTEHCQAVCDGLKLPLSVRRLNLQPKAGESVEAVARQGRYQALAELLPENGMLLTAQHQDDQAETLLLQLMRGAGLEGLAAMPLCRSWYAGWHARPLLGYRREQLAQYAQQHSLDWIEDPSNQDERFDRNFLRQQVMPLLRKRWPGCDKTIARSASHLGSNLRLLQDLAKAELQHCVDEQGRPRVDRLLSLPEDLRLAVLREWLKPNGVLPDTRRLRVIAGDVLRAAADAAPRVDWAGMSVRRYRNGLWLTASDLGAAPTQPVCWPDQEVLQLPKGCGFLQRKPAATGIAAAYWQQGRVSVAWRGQFSPCRLPGREARRRFKDLCQMFAIPPWQRDHLPLIFVDDQLVSFAGFSLCDSEFNQSDQAFIVEWHAA